MRTLNNGEISGGVIIIERTLADGHGRAANSVRMVYQRQPSAARRTAGGVAWRINKSAGDQGNENEAVAIMGKINGGSWRGKDENRACAGFEPGSVRQGCCAGGHGGSRMRRSAAAPFCAGERRIKPSRRRAACCARRFILTLWQWHQIGHQGGDASGMGAMAQKDVSVNSVSISDQRRENAGSGSALDMAVAWR